MIPALPTRHAGVLFRSRLEARWAVFFDHLGIRWEYEPEGFRLPSGEGYLPDFRLWGCKDGGGEMYAEVKPHGGDFAKARALAAMLNDGATHSQYVWLCEGPPNSGSWQVVSTDQNESEAVWNHNRHRLWFLFNGGGREDEDGGEWIDDQRTLDAVSAALSARFGT